MQYEINEKSKTYKNNTIETLTNIKQQQQDNKQLKKHPQPARLQFQIKRSKLFNNPLENLGISYPIYYDTSSLSKLDKQIQFAIKISAYKDFISSIAFQNSIFVEAPSDKNYPLYKAYVGKGNNSQLIRMIFKKRTWWTLTDQKEDSIINILWTQLRSQKFLDQLNNGETIKNTLTMNTIQSFEKNIKINNFPHLLKMHNHLEDNFHLTNKKALFYNMRSYYQSIGKNVFQYLPLTFHIQEGKEDSEYIKFKEYFQEQQKKNQPNIWIIKPGEITNRGCGIKVLNDIYSIQLIIDSKETHAISGIRKTYIIQKYIENPLLYQKRKFDIRCYYLLTTFNGNLKAYWYQEGYVRTSSQEFTVKNFNKNIHLTNDAIQNKDDTYGKYEIGNKVSYCDMNKYIQQNYPNKDFYYNILPQMKNIAKDTLNAVYAKIDPFRKENTLEIYGLDFMVDQQFNVWLIEINTNPALDICSPLLSKIIPEMIENTFRIAIDPVFPPAGFTNFKNNFNIDNPLENNKYELFFDELTDGNNMKIIENDQKLNWDTINKEEEKLEENE
ncbi:tubulin-tyrosine ligase family protein, putative [Ichthyophthirius multifiliis]|uniref:Tubulin-tyrosine ligase family protein, putative n=1 Tax=Ichthyophthirius multifiliis TaxID=5932 RepID=G0QS37_ICHMU|nr:tubulin-tyrosine ligase family protein, putative [Ichthyophthirius multifiliis]EGR31979.1 tubulin-tyrosine ligase family protein, putative [Ichthyophthirius multifiliis]|eukprot:XP_004035465.1 tubulin-tyrosine ligase family protein, putative [Ichthyophthirius multifiliis]